MNIQENRPPVGDNEEKGPSHSTEQQSSAPNDLPDSAHDSERLQSEETTIDLPDVKDIPGQEFIHPPLLGELADTTISSADEEGEGLFDDEEATDAAGI